MLSQYNVIDIHNALLEESPPPPFPPADQREAWEKVRRDLGEERVAGMIAQAEADADAEIPELTATGYLEFTRNGERSGFEALVSQRRAMLSSLMLGECLEYEGRFLDPLLNLVWAICEESSWAYPAHQYTLTDIEKPYIDLFASMTGRQLAEFDLILGDAMDPLVRKRIRDEVDGRLLSPYLVPHTNWWWMYNTQNRRTNNWNAVCNGNVVSAAILLEPDMRRLAEIIARAARSLDDYLDTFDADGGSTEGPGYWSYGYGNYVLLAHLVEQRTNGRVSFLDSDQIRKISQFPARTVLSHNLFVNFSDCDLHISLRPSLLAYLSRRLDLPELMALARQQPLQNPQRPNREIVPWDLRQIFWPVDTDDTTPFIPAKHDWYSEMMWMMARLNPEDPDALVLAAKGGHNAEMHNQNDVGNIIVHVNGESVIADIGRGRYTRAYFSPERYNHFVCQSLGHSTPVPNNQQQGAGLEFAAELLDHQADETRDLLMTELKNAYPEAADLESLQRTVILHREGSGWVELIDSVKFASKSGTLESVLTTFGDVIIDDDTTVRLIGEKGALAITYDSSVLSVDVQKLHDVDLAEGPADVNRVIFEFKEPVESGEIRLEIRPIAK